VVGIYDDVGFLIDWASCRRDNEVKSIIERFFSLKKKKKKKKKKRKKGDRERRGRKEEMIIVF
jgi:hypothetical protein